MFLASIAGSIVLARLLEPEDFGIFGMTLIFAGLANKFGDLGFGLALVQRKEIRDEHISSLFVVNLLLFSVLTVVLILVSPLVGSFFESPLAGRALSVIALTFLASPFSAIARVIMQRQMNFKDSVVADVVDRITGALTSIAFAWQGQGVWSLVYGQLVGTLSRTLVLLAWAGWKPSLRFSARAMRDLFSFGFNIFLKNLLIYGSDKIDYLITGKRLGPGVLGLYEKAFNLMDVAVKELSIKISGGVLFSAFSKIQDDNGRLRAAYMKVILSLSLICFPVFFGLFLVAPSFIHVLFGEKWLPSVVALQILCVAGVLRMYLQVTSTVINAMGYVAAEVWIRAVAFVLLTIGCWFGSFWGIAGVSTAVTVTTGVLAITVISYFGKLTALGWTSFLRPQAPAFVAAVFMGGAVLTYQNWFDSMLGIYSTSMLLSSIAVGMASYGAGLWFLRPAPVVSLFRELGADVRLAIQRRYTARGKIPFGSNF
jgi:PST family polysaccharide transporter